jgi:hypothetical protein
MNPAHGLNTTDEMDATPMLMTHPSRHSQALNASFPMDFRTNSEDESQANKARRAAKAAAERATQRAQAGSVTEIGVARGSVVSHIQLVQEEVGQAAAAAATAHDDSEWVTRFSDDHGANYYKHRVTGEKRWEMPAEHGGGKRIADDGLPYTMEEFVAHYGGTVEWLAAEPYVP